VPEEDDEEDEEEELFALDNSDALFDSGILGGTEAFSELRRGR